MAAFIISLFVNLISLAESSPETYKDIIEKSYRLSLQRDRRQAASLLISTLEKESNTNEPASIEIKKVFQKVPFSPETGYRQI